MTNEFHSKCSSSTSWSSQPDTEDDRMIALMLTQEYSELDGGVARRLSNLAPIPVVPRINSFLLTVSEANLDHQRLLQRLQVYGLFEVGVSGDGNGQFRALSDQMFKTPEHHKLVRKEVVKQLKEQKSFYESYVPMKYKHYYKKMAKSGEWGDHVTLQAAADRVNALLLVLLMIWLSFWSEVHYNSLYGIGAAPPPKNQGRNTGCFEYQGNDLKPIYPLYIAYIRRCSARQHEDFSMSVYLLSLFVHSFLFTYYINKCTQVLTFVLFGSSTNIEIK